MLKLWGTSGAALKFALPGCDAVMVHEPAPVICTVLPPIVQLPVAVKLTLSPEEAVALTLKSGSPNVLFAKAPNVIV